MREATLQHFPQQLLFAIGRLTGSASLRNHVADLGADGVAVNEGRETGGVVSCPWLRLTFMQRLATCLALVSRAAPEVV
jgi:hypothetical protein